MQIVKIMLHILHYSAYVINSLNKTTFGPVCWLFSEVKELCWWNG